MSNKILTVSKTKEESGRVGNLFLPMWNDLREGSLLSWILLESPFRNHWSSPYE